MCNRSFKKGDIYYKHRTVISGYEILAYEYLECPKCRYKQESQEKRFNLFKTKCHHPIVSEEWSFIPGETVMQPDHDECVICGEWL